MTSPHTARRFSMATALAVTASLVAATPGSAQPSPSDPPSLPKWVATEDKVPQDYDYTREETDWTTRDVSTRASADSLIAAAGATALTAAGGKEVGVVAVRKVAGRPVVTTQKVSGAAGMRTAIAGLQADRSVVSLSVDHRRKVLSAPVRPAAAECTDGRPSSPYQWDYAALGLKSVHDSGVSGTGTTVAVIDSGVDGKQPDLKGQVLSGADYVSGGNGWNDQVGHGTHVAGTVAALNNGVGTTGVAPGAKILPVRVADADGFAWDSDTASGIQYSVNKGVQVINLSLAGGPDSVISTMIKYALSKNVLVAAAAGNERDEGNPVRYPAAYPGVLGVGATNQKKAPTFYSESHSYVRIAAPGENIVSTVPVNSAAPEGLCLSSGTSMAAPHVAGTAALLYQATGRQVRGSKAVAFLIGSTTYAGAAGYDMLTGYGIVNPGKAVSSAKCWVARTCTIPLANVRDNASQRWVQRAHIHLSAAGPSTVSLLNWPKWLAKGTKKPTQMTYPLTATTYYRQRAVSVYLWAAARRIGPQSSINYYAGLLGKGYTQQEVYAILMASSETYKKAGNTNTKWVTYAYREVTGFTPSSAALKYYVNELARGVSRRDVSRRLIGSPYGLGRIIDVQYQRFLGRAPSSGSRAYWVKQLKAGVSVRSISANLVASPEYRKKY